jgi:hypothetical protein
VNAVRDKRVARMISEAPESAKKTLRESFSGSASPRKAIKAMCLTCVGYDRQEITNCTGYSCPLWAYRPYQEDASSTPFRGREGDEIDLPEGETS